MRNAVGVKRINVVTDTGDHSAKAFIIIVCFRYGVYNAIDKGKVKPRGRSRDTILLFNYDGQVVAYY